MQNSSFLEASRLITLMLAMIMLIGCSGGPVSPPQGPSGIITATPITSASAPFTITNDSSQTFAVSEAGYGGAFSFGGSVGSGHCGGPYSAQPFTAPAGTTVTLSKSTHVGPHFCIVAGASYAVTVKDSLGNSTTIYTN